MIEIIKNFWLLLLVGQYPDGPIGGLAATLMLSALGLLLSFPVAVALALACTGRFAGLRRGASWFISIVRGIPFIMIIFWAYFLTPSLIGMPVSGFTTMVGALVVYESTYLAEIVRGGIEALPNGQTEAARALGITYFVRMRKVILPQALYNVLPGLVTQFVAIVKDTSLAYVVSVPELTFAAAQVNMQLLVRPLEVFGILALTYFVICLALTRLAAILERRVAHRHASAEMA